MSAGSKDNSGLERVFEKYADLQMSQGKETNNRIDKLSDKIGQLAQIMAKSEERHNSHVEKYYDLDKKQEEHEREFKIYRQNNDERVMNVEKQVLLLDTSNKNIKNRFSKQDKVLISVISAVAVAITLVYLGLR